MDSKTILAIVVKHVADVLYEIADRMEAKDEPGPMAPPTPASDATPASYLGGQRLT